MIISATMIVIISGLWIILTTGIVAFRRLVCRKAGCSNILFVVKVHFFRYRSIILFLHFIDSFQTLSVIHKPGDAGIPPISVMVIFPSRQSHSGR